MWEKQLGGFPASGMGPYIWRVDRILSTDGRMAAGPWGLGRKGWNMARKRVKLQVELELGKRHSLVEGGLAEMRARVKAAGLSEIQKLCLAMLWYHDLSQEELSRRLRISQQAVSNHVRRGLERLRAAGVSQRRRRRYVLPQMHQAPPTWLDQLGPEEVKAGW